MKHSQGFSLIELMIVVAIVGILAVVSFGFYGDSVIASNRSEGRAGLNEVAASLEKCRALYGAYDAANCNVALPQVTDTNYYSIAASAIAATSFTLTATPVAGEPQAGDLDCTTLTLTNTGVQGATGADTTVCW